MHHNAQSGVTVDDNRSEKRKEVKNESENCDRLSQRCFLMEKFAYN